MAKKKNKEDNRLLLGTVRMPDVSNPVRDEVFKRRSAVSDDWEPSKELLDAIKSYEKFSPVVYKDGNGVETIGYGTTDKKIIAKYRGGKRMSKREAERLFNRHVDDIIAQMKDSIPNFNAMSNNQKDAMTSYVYNVGIGGVTRKSPKLMEALKKKNWKEAARQMDFGYNDEKNSGLRRRRDEEQALFTAYLDMGLEEPTEEELAAAHARMQQNALEDVLSSRNVLELQDPLRTKFKEAYRVAVERKQPTFTWNGIEFATDLKAEGGPVATFLHNITHPRDAAYTLMKASGASAQLTMPEIIDALAGLSDKNYTGNNAGEKSSFDYPEMYIYGKSEGAEELSEEEKGYGVDYSAYLKEHGRDPKEVKQYKGNFGADIILPESAKSYLDEIVGTDKNFTIGYTDVSGTDDVAGHLGRINKDKNGEYIISYSDLWDFEPRSYAKDWAAGNLAQKGFAYTQAWLLDKIGNPFIVRSNKKVKFIPDSEYDSTINKLFESDEYGPKEMGYYSHDTYEKLSEHMRNNGRERNENIKSHGIQDALNMISTPFREITKRPDGGPVVKTPYIASRDATSVGQIAPNPNAMDITGISQPIDLTEIVAGGIPVIGDVMDARDLYTSIRDRDAIGALFASVGFLPIVGGAAKSALRMRYSPDVLRKRVTYGFDTPEEAARMIGVAEDDLGNTINLLSENINKLPDEISEEAVADIRSQVEKFKKWARESDIPAVRESDKAFNLSRPFDPKHPIEDQKVFDSDYERIKKFAEKYRYDIPGKSDIKSDLELDDLYQSLIRQHRTFVRGVRADNEQDAIEYLFNLAPNTGKGRYGLDTYQHPDIESNYVSNSVDQALGYATGLGYDGGNGWIGFMRIGEPLDFTKSLDRKDWLDQAEFDYDIRTSDTRWDVLRKKRKHEPNVSDRANNVIDFISQRREPVSGSYMPNLDELNSELDAIFKKRTKTANYRSRMDDSIEKKRASKSLLEKYGIRATSNEITHPDSSYKRYLNNFYKNLSERGFKEGDVVPNPMSVDEYYTVKDVIIKRFNKRSERFVDNRLGDTYNLAGITHGGGSPETDLTHYIVTNRGLIQPILYHNIGDVNPDAYTRAHTGERSFGLSRKEYDKGGPVAPRDATTVGTPEPNPNAPNITNPSSGVDISEIVAGGIPVVGDIMDVRDFLRSAKDRDAVGMFLSGIGLIPVFGGFGKQMLNAKRIPNNLTPRDKELLDAMPEYANPNSPAGEAWLNHKKRLISGAYKRLVGEDLIVENGEINPSQIDTRAYDALDPVIIDEAKRFEMPDLTEDEIKEILKNEEGYFIVGSKIAKGKTNNIPKEELFGQMKDMTDEEIDNMMKSHEIEHLVHYPDQAPPKDAFSIEQIIEKEDLTDEQKDVLRNYFKQASGTELSARGTQIKDYFGLTDDSQEVTPEMLEYASRHYIEDYGDDNMMSQFFDGIVDYKKMAKWITDHASVGLGVYFLNEAGQRVTQDELEEKKQGGFIYHSQKPHKGDPKISDVLRYRSHKFYIYGGKMNNNSKKQNKGSVTPITTFNLESRELPTVEHIMDVVSDANRESMDPITDSIIEMGYVPYIRNYFKEGGANSDGILNDYFKKWNEWMKRPRASRRKNSFENASELTKIQNYYRREVEPSLKKKMANGGYTDDEIKELWGAFTPSGETPGADSLDALMGTIQEFRYNAFNASLNDIRLDENVRSAIDGTIRSMPPEDFLIMLRNTNGFGADYAKRLDKMPDSNEKDEELYRMRDVMARATSYAPIGLGAAYYNNASDEEVVRQMGGLVQHWGDRDWGPDEPEKTPEQIKAELDERYKITPDMTEADRLMMLNLRSFQEGGELSNEYKVKYLYDLLLNDAGMSQNQALAVLGNLWGESHWSESASGDTNTSYGIQQWHGDRRKKLIEFAKNRSGNEDPTFWDQAHFLVKEYREGQGFLDDNSPVKLDGYLSYSKSDFQNAESLHDAVVAWNQGFGRPHKKVMRTEDRYKGALKAAEMLGITVDENMPSFYGINGISEDPIVPAFDSFAVTATKPSGTPAATSVAQNTEEDDEDIPAVPGIENMTREERQKLWFETYGKQILEDYMAEENRVRQEQEDARRLQYQQQAEAQAKRDAEAAEQARRQAIIEQALDEALLNIPGMARGK